MPRTARQHPEPPTAPTPRDMSLLVGAGGEQHRDELLAPVDDDPAAVPRDIEEPRCPGVLRTVDLAILVPVTDQLPNRGRRYGFGLGGPAAKAAVGATVDEAPGPLE